MLINRRLTLACCAGLLNLLAPTALAQPHGPTRVKVAQVEMRELPATTTLVGTVEPITRSVLGTEIGGLVEAMPVRQGDFVQEGDLICRLKAETLTHELAGARARLEELKAEHSRWVFELERINKLYGKDDASEKEVYETRASHDSARHAIGSQEAVVARLESELAKTEIQAPFSGFIVDRRTEVGQWIVQGGEVVEIVDLHTVLVRVNAPESALPHLRVGAKAEVRIDALKHGYEGRIRHIMLQADNMARTFPVEVEVVNPASGTWRSQLAAGGEIRSGTGAAASEQSDGVPLLAGGMFARVTMVCGPAVSAPAVPKDAVVTRGTTDYVAMVVPGQEEGSLMAMPMPVTTGLDIGDWIAITSGNLPPGAQVVTRGNENIMFPTPVVIMQPGEPSGRTAKGGPPDSSAAGS